MLFCANNFATFRNSRSCQVTSPFKHVLCKVSHVMYAQIKIADDFMTKCTFSWFFNAFRFQKKKSYIAFRTFPLERARVAESALLKRLIDKRLTAF